MRHILLTWRWSLRPAGIFCLLVVVTGCSSYGSISGKVTYQNRPLTGGTVLFTSSSGKGSQSSPIREDGSYTITKMPIGLAKVAIQSASGQQSKGIKGPPAGMMPKAGQMPEGVKSGVYNPSATKGPGEDIPDKYGDPEVSGLTFQVKGGAQTFDIPLK
jgi:hypothetical protein